MTEAIPPALPENPTRALAPVQRAATGNLAATQVARSLREPIPPAPPASSPHPLKNIFFSTDFLQAILFPAKSTGQDARTSRIAARRFFIARVAGHQSSHARPAGYW